MKRGRLGIIAVMLVSLAASTFLRQMSLNWQTAASSRTGSLPSGGVGQLNSFALALVLGGLRGPLVNYLWTSSEAQKNERNLQDFDTKLEWIRLLQPEFDTVLIFQMWNKAYNVSVLMASPADKYVCITQALDYGDDVLKEKPGDMNILGEVSGIYSIKLGGHPSRPEQKFYNRQLCEETLTDANRMLAYPDDPNFTRLWPASRMLDDNNNILPELLEPTRPRPATVSGDWNDGSKLQYLAQFQPFPRGLGPAALAYNYAKRAQVALSVDGQRPLQVSAMVVDSRPALELEGWEQQSGAMARYEEARAFGIAVPAEDSAEHDGELAAIAPAAKAVDSRALEAAVQEYALGARLSKEVFKELIRHLSNKDYSQRYSLYGSHLDDAQQVFCLYSADRDYLLARMVPDDQAAALRRDAIANYQHAVAQSERVLLKYYTDEQILHATFPKAVTRASLDAMPDGNVVAFFNRSMELSSKLPPSQYEDDRVIYLRVIARGLSRLKQLVPPQLH
jgi:hypothetical protein